MKVTIQKGVLQELIHYVANIVPAKTTIQILGNIYVSARDRKFTLQATDLDVSIISHVTQDIQEPGELLVNASKFRDIIKELPEVQIELAAADNHLEISYGNTFSCKIPTLDVAEFPQLPLLKEGQTIRLSSSIMRKMVEKTAFAVSVDETRMSLRGVCWELENGEFRMIATDGHRLGFYRRMNIEPSEVSSKRVIVSHKALKQLTHVVGDRDIPMEVLIGDVAVAFKGESFVIYSKLIEGIYPNYQQVIPKSNKNLLTVEREVLLSALRRVSILSHAKTRQVRFKLSADMLQLKAANSDWGGEALENIEVSYKGQELEVGFNATYFLEILRLCETEKSTITLGTSLSACTILPDTALKDEENIFLIMPLRIVEEKNET